MFDTSKPYGIIGGVFGIARFEQGGKYYDAQHNLLDDEGNPLKSNKQKQSSNPPVGSTSENQTPSGQVGGADQTVGQQAEGQTNAPAQPAGNADAEQKAALVARAKTLGIKSPHLLGLEKLRDKVAAAEGALNPDAQLAANLAG